MPQPEAIPLNIIARAPFDIYFEGKANALSARNRIGDFDILPGHADFFSMLSPGEVTIEPSEGDTVSFPVKSGIVTVKGNEVFVFVNV